MRRFLRAECFASLALLAAIFAFSCATKSPAPEESAATEPPPPPPGADRWDGGALKLPSRAPVVGVARISSLLDNTRRLRQWIAAEPAMFGEDGEQFVQQFRAGWNQVSQGFGFDPLSSETPTRVGIDGERPLYFGLYPASAAGSDFVERVESAIRETAEIPEEKRLGSALDAMRSGDREIPSKLTRNVLEAVGSSSPTAGFRLVVPIADSAEFTERLGSAVRSVGYSQMSTDSIAGVDGEDDGELPPPVAYYSSSAPWPALLVRPGPEWLKIDILFRRSDTDSSAGGDKLREKLKSSLGGLLESTGSGRPAAPRPVDRPVLAVAADQSRTAAFTRMQAYKNALDSVSRTAVERRNQALVESLSRAVTVGEDWARGSEVLTGSSYAFHGVPSDSKADHLFRITSTLFGPVPGSEPDIDRVDVGLGVDDRGFGLAVDLDPFVDSAWQEWLEREEASELTEASAIAGEHPIPYLLSLPRNLAFVVASLDRVIRDSLPDGLKAAYEHRRALQRIEIATAGSDVQALRARPKFVGLLTFDREADEEDIDAVLEMLPPFVELLFDVTGEDDSEDEALDSVELELAPDQLESFGLPESHPAHPFFYYAHPEQGRGFVFFSHGLGRDAAAGEVESVRSGERAPMNDRAFFLRLEPATAVASLTAFDADAFAPLQPGILAQRIGAIVLTITPRRDGDVQRLRYEFELRQPPDL